MSDEERDTSELDALEDTIEDEPQDSEVTTPFEDPFDDDTSPDMVDDDEELELYADKYRSVEDLESAYREAQKKISQQDDYATLGRHIAPQWDAFDKWQKGQEQASQPEPVWNPPHEIGSVQRAIDLLGTEGWDALPVQERSRAEEYLNYYNQKWRSWQTNPHQFAEDMVAPVVEQMIGNRFAELEAQMGAASFWREHADELKDNMGEFQDLLRSGVPTAAARELIQLRKVASERKEVESQKDELQRKKDRLKGRSSSRSQRSGGPSSSNRPDPSGKSFGEIFNDVSDSVGAVFGEESSLGASSKL
ncbi:MAG: hypothetical protein CL793_07355 [Chloroflexi bacterium]|nr:hypothetical protein [Chloroflexota bacterium]MBG95053.1 hypothetical protein [Chloroflexota bacterium]|tara:strand:- start:2732 stop:3649 length:918 start_codon:yes stop_codon:yes gene_type:complete